MGIYTIATIFVYNVVLALEWMLIYNDCIINYLLIMFNPNLLLIIKWIVQYANPLSFLFGSVSPSIPVLLLGVHVRIIRG